MCGLICTNLGNFRYDVRWLHSSSQWGDWSIHHDMAQVGKKLLGPVLTFLGLNQLRIVVDKISVNKPINEIRMLQYISDEGDIRLKANKRQF